MTAGLTDLHGRVATDLRVSLTDRCDLRCSYCMPAEGLAWIPRSSILTDEETARLVRIAVTRLGVRQVRFTGGEPLLRPGLAAIIEQAAALEPRPEISLTTNAVTLARHADVLRAAGLDRVNISLDTLDAARFQALTRRDRLQDVLAGIAAAEHAGLTPVKLNAVIRREANDLDILPLLDYALGHGHQLRYIEHMPLDAGHTWTRQGTVSASEIRAVIETCYRLTPDPGERGGAPAETYLVDGHTDQAGQPAKVGIIASVTRPFCAACDRTRLTAEGTVRSCLFSHQETDLRTLLREGADDEAIAALWRTAMRGKPAAHGIDTPGFRQPERAMSAIGG
jgi:cyclic pyranopterin phosphate synthase